VGAEKTAVERDRREEGRWGGGGQFGVCEGCEVEAGVDAHLVGELRAVGSELLVVAVVTEGLSPRMVAETLMLGRFRNRKTITTTRPRTEGCLSGSEREE
jgi:hypothetical protein